MASNAATLIGPFTTKQRQKPLALLALALGFVLIVADICFTARSYSSLSQSLLCKIGVIGLGSMSLVSSVKITKESFRTGHLLLLNKFPALLSGVAFSYSAVCVSLLVFSLFDSFTPAHILPTEIGLLVGSIARLYLPESTDGLRRSFKHLVRGVVLMLIVCIVFSFFVDNGEWMMDKAAYVTHTLAPAICDKIDGIKNFVIERW